MTIASLANAELAVMELLWNAESLTAKRIQQELYGGADKAQHGTVQKLLKRLENKGFVTRKKTMAAHSFSAAISHRAYTGSQLESLADRLTGGSLAPLITHLVEGNKLSKAEIERLRRVLEEA